MSWEDEYLFSGGRSQREEGSSGRTKVSVRCEKRRGRNLRSSFPFLFFSPIDIYLSDSIFFLFLFLFSKKESRILFNLIQLKESDGDGYVGGYGVAARFIIVSSEMAEGEGGQLWRPRKATLNPWQISEASMNIHRSRNSALQTKCFKF